MDMYEQLENYRLSCCKANAQIKALEGENKKLTEFIEEIWMHSGYQGCFTDWLEKEAQNFLDKVRVKYEVGEF